jgi:hypothetical protein
MFSATRDDPPSEYGITWSKWRFSMLPHFTHRLRSRFHTASFTAVGIRFCSSSGSEVSAGATSGSISRRNLKTCDRRFARPKRRVGGTSRYRPDAGSHLLVHAHAFGWSVSVPAPSGRFIELPVLGERADQGSEGLVDGLGVRAAAGEALVMTFVDEDSSVLFDAVGIRSARANAHQQDARTAPDSVVHTSLEVDALIPAHVEIGK